MKKLATILFILLIFTACNHQKTVKCSACDGKGKETYNYTERVAIAKCQLYFAGHMRECKICQKHTDDDSTLCSEARDKLYSIMEDAKKQPAKMITEECWACGGSGKLIEQ